MAKNKKQDRKQPQSERTQQSPASTMESQTEQRITQATPGDMARKGREKRFGHN